MAFRLQMMHALVERHPDRAHRLKTHVEALESAIDGEPHRCLERVRALFEATFHSVAPHLGIAHVAGEDFPQQNRRIIQALDFKLAGHPEEEKIGRALVKLTGGINGTIGALAELSNIGGMRHGGALDWPTLQRQHAQMLGGLCDTLVSFLFDIAWSRDDGDVADAVRYDDNPGWNDVLDEEWGSLTIGEGEFYASQILHALDPTQYETLRDEWLTEADEPEAVAA
jgi:Abortive infection C-terminus